MTDTEAELCICVLSLLVAAFVVMGSIAAGLGVLFFYAIESKR